MMTSSEVYFTIERAQDLRRQAHFFRDAALASFSIPEAEAHFEDAQQCLDEAHDLLATLPRYARPRKGAPAFEGPIKAINFGSFGKPRTQAGALLALGVEEVCQ